MQLASNAQRRMASIVPPLIVVAAGLLAYANTFEVPFLFDDLVRIVDEPAIRDAWPPWRAMHNSNRPLAHYTFALNYWMHGYDVAGYHVVNIVIHLSTALALFALVRRTCLRCAPSLRRDASIIAFAAALVWVVHPLNTQAVTYIVQRLESLMGLAYLLTPLCFVCAQDSRFKWRWYLASILACAFGMGCKEVMVTAPLAVLWYDRVFVASSWRALLRARWAYYAGLAASWGVLAWAMLHYTVDYTGGALLNVEGLTPWTYLLTQSTVILHYLKLAFWPDAQCVYYAWPIADSIYDVTLSFGMMSALAALTLWAIVWRPHLGFLIGIFFLILAPTSSIIPIKDVAFEHRMYLPLAAIVVLTMIAAHAVLIRLATAHTMARGLFVTCSLFIATALGAATYERNKVYESEVSVWTDTLNKSPRNVKVWVGLGGIFAKDKKFADAERCFTTALSIDPENVKANAAYAGLLIERGDYERAQQHLNAAFAKDPNDRDAIVNMGHLLSATGHAVEAQEYLEAAVKMFPENEELQTALIVNLCYLGQASEAVTQSQANLARRPNSANAHIDVAASLIMVGRHQEALQHCQRAIELDNTAARAYATYAMAIADQDLEAAIRSLAQACAIQPTSFEYQLALGNLQMSMQPSEAAKHYHAALALRPDDIEVLLRLGMAHDASGDPEKGLPYLERVTQLQPDLVEAQEMVRAIRRSIDSARQ